MLACKSRSIGKPAGWDQTLDGECGTIFVTDAVDTLSGMNFMYKPTPEHLAALNAEIEPVLGE